MFDTDTPVPAQVPASWLLPQAAGPVIRFVDSAFSDSESPARIRAALPSARDIQATPMPLRQIFIALARVYRLSE
jgi:ABC-2 type transport system ATP-binding protein